MDLNLVCESGDYKQHFLGTLVSINFFFNNVNFINNLPYVIRDKYCLKNVDLLDQFVLINNFQMMLGLLVGSFIGGRLGDRFGRKPVMFAAVAALIPTVGCAGIYPNYAVYATLRFLSGTLSLQQGNVFFEKL